MPDVSEEYRSWKAGGGDLVTEFERFKQAELRQAPIQQTHAPVQAERQPIGATVGGITGAIAGKGVASIPMGAVGAAGGEAIQQLVEHATGSPFAPKTSEQAATQIVQEAALSTAFDVVGRGLGKVGQRVLAPFARTVTPEAEETIKFIEQAAPKTKAGQSVAAQPLLPSERTENWALDILGNVAESSVIGGGAIRAYKVNREAVMEGMARDFADQFYAKIDPADVGKAIVESTKKGFKAEVAPAKVLYNTIDEAVKPVKKTVYDVEFGNASVQSRRLIPREVEESVVAVDIAPIKAGLERMAKIAQDAGGLEGSHAGDDLIKYVMDKPDRVDYQVAKEMRTRIRTLGDRLAVENKKAPAIGKAEGLEKQLTTQIGDALERFDPTTKALWDEANSIYRGANKKFKNDFLKRLVKLSLEEGAAQPGNVAKTILQANQVTHVKLVKEAVDAETWRKFQGYAVHDLLAKSEREGVLTGVKLESAAFGRTGYGDPMMKELFGDAGSRYVKEFAQALTLGQERQAQGLGKMFIQLKQAGAIVELAGAASLLSEDVDLWQSGAIILGPFMLAHLFTNPAAAKLIVQGVKTPAGTPLAGSIAARLAGFLAPRPSRPESSATPQPAVTRPSLTDYQPTSAFQLQP